MNVTYLLTRERDYADNWRFTGETAEADMLAFREAEHAVCPIGKWSCWREENDGSVERIMLPELPST